MNREELLELIAEIHRFNSELDDVEVKSAMVGTPKRLFASLSAFSNRPEGGVILFGFYLQSIRNPINGIPNRLQIELC